MNKEDKKVAGDFLLLTVIFLFLISCGYLLITTSYEENIRLHQKKKTCGLVKRKYASTKTRSGKVEEFFSLKINDTIISVDEREYEKWSVGDSICIVGNVYKIDTIY